MSELDVVHHAMDAYTAGGAVLLGFLAKYAMLVYRRRKQLAELDTWTEVRGLVAFLLPIGFVAFAMLPSSIDALERIGVSLVLAFFVALHGNSGPLGKAPDIED